MRKLAVLCAVLMIGTSVISGCSGQKTLAPSEMETEAQWGLNLQESREESEAESESAEEPVQKIEINGTEVIEVVGGVKMLVTNTLDAVAQSAVNVRSGPGTGYDKLGELKAEERVRMNGVCAHGWIRIFYNDGTGYVSASYLNTEDGSISLEALAAEVARMEIGTLGAEQPKETEQETEEETETTETSQAVEETAGAGTAKAKSPVNVRSGPGAKHGQIGALVQDETVKVLDSSDQYWWKVEYKGREGYVYAPYLIMTEE